MRLLALTAGMAALYVAAGRLGLQLAVVNASATAVWPPSGLAVAAVLLLGRRVAPGIFLGAFVTNATNEVSLATATGIATRNTLAALAGAFLVERFAGGRGAFDRAIDVFRFAALAGLAAPLLSATIGAASLTLGGFAPAAAALPVWLTWWIGDAMGVLLFAPAVLVWNRGPRPEWTRPRILEAMALLACLLLAALLMSGFLLPKEFANTPFGFLAVPVLLWAAFRYGQREAAIAPLLLFAVNLLGTVAGHGQFARPDPNQSLLLLQGFSGFTMVLTLFVSAVAAERGRAEGKLRELNLALEARVSERTAELRRREEELDLFFTLSLDMLCIANVDGYFKRVSPVFEATLGYSPEELLAKPFVDFVHPDDLASTAAEVARLAHGQPTIRFENRYRRRAGDYRWLAWTCQPAPDGTLYAIARDVTQQKLDEAQLAASERRYREVFERSFGIICTHALDGTILSINPAGAQAMGYTPETLVGRSFLELVPESRRDRVTDALEALPSTGVGEGQLVARAASGEERTLMYRHSWVAGATPPYVLVHAVDITERVRAEKVLEHQAMHDPLTGCANRALFLDHFELALARGRRARSRGDRRHLVALVYLDLDAFKSVNDRLGHAAGDFVLRELAHRLRGRLREVDTLARLGGDEFAVLVGELHDTEGARRLVDSLLRAIRLPLRWREQELEIDASAGVALYPLHGECPEDLVEFADRAMYHVKQERGSIDRPPRPA